MPIKKRSLLTFFLSCIFLFATVSQVISETRTYQIPPRQQKIISINLNSGDLVSGTLVVNSEGTVDFWISNLQNMNFTSYSEIRQTDFSFTAETSGTFLLHILNRNADFSISVTLHYNVVHRIFGMPQELFLLIVIVGVILLMIICWVVLSKT